MNLCKIFSKKYVQYTVNTFEVEGLSVESVGAVISGLRKVNEGGNEFQFN